MDLIKLDLRDRRLLFELEKDGRQPLTQLAKRMQVSKEVAHYRLQKMLDSGLASLLFANWEPAACGYDNYALYFRIQGMPAKTERQLHGFATSLPQTAWIASLAGRFDLVIKLYVRSVKELDDFLSKFLDKYGPYVSEKQVTVRTGQTYFYSPKRFFQGFGVPDVHHSKFRAKTHELDSIDEKILMQLSKNARRPYMELAKECGVSAETVRQRMKQLIRTDVIKGFTCYPDRRKLGFSHYKIFLRFHYPTSERVQPLIKWCEQNESTLFMVSCIGAWDLELDVDVLSSEEFHALLKELAGKFRDIISDYSWVLIADEQLLNWP